MTSSISGHSHTVCVSCVHRVTLLIIVHKVLDCSDFIRAPGSWSPRDEPKSFPASSLILLNSLEQQGSVTRTESSWTKRTQRRFPSREEGERARGGWVTWRWASRHESQVDSNYSHEWSECCRVNKFLWLEIKNRWKHTHTEEDMTSERKQRTVAVITFGLPLNIKKSQQQQEKEEFFC